MLGTFHKALVTRPVSVAGINLLPFSLWQEFNLRALGNPYVCGGVVSVDALVESVLWCLSIHGKVQWHERTQWRVSALSAYLRGKVSRNVAVWVAAHAAMTTHMVRYSKVPEHWEKTERHTDAVRAPWELHLVRILCESFGMTESQAWNTPINKARAYADVVAESNGDKSLVSDDEAEGIALARGAA